MGLWKRKPVKWALGCQRSPLDVRDWDYSRIANERVSIPRAVDLTEHLSTTILQGPAPTCVGVAIAHQIMIEESIRGTVKPAGIPSAKYIWDISRKQHQGNDIKITGTFPRLAYKGVAKMGCPPASIWPYSTRERWLNTMPGQKAMRYAAGRYGLQYYFVSALNRSQKVRQTLASAHPVTIATQVGDAMQRYLTASSDILHKPGPYEVLLGGHYMLITGYRGDYFIVVNSYPGSEIILMHEDYIEWDESTDFGVITGWQNLKSIS